ncbi:MAG: hypothetical protein LH474_11105 [Chamaesiphon sp.]|nr:hypothetical protein [Chamaesiphon sp.]
MKSQIVTNKDRNGDHLENHDLDSTIVTIPVSTSSTDLDSNTTPLLESELPVTSVSKRKKPIALILGGLGIGAIVAGVAGYNYWEYSSTHQATDNAIVAGHIHQISSKIVGTIASE